MLIFALRGSANAAKEIDNNEHRFISSVNYRGNFKTIIEMVLAWHTPASGNGFRRGNATAQSVSSASARHALPISR